jgi:hypothetical protein
MATSKKAAKWTAAEIQSHIKKIQSITGKLKKENKDGTFTAVSEEDLLKKFNRINSPMIVGQSWNNTAGIGGTINYSVTIYNPDPGTASSLIVHTWVGSGNSDTNTGTFLLNVDTRFPRLVQPSSTIGQSLASGASVTLSFAIKIPASADKTYYLGNSCLFRLDFHDAGTYLDRGAFVFGVV